MALYIGNRKVAALSQTINPGKVGGGLRVSDGILKVAPGDLMGLLGETIQNSEELDGETQSQVDSLVQALWSRMRSLQVEGSTEGSIGGDMIDTRSNPIFYSELTRLD